MRGGVAVVGLEGRGGVSGGRGGGGFGGCATFVAFPPSCGGGCGRCIGVAGARAGAGHFLQFVRWGYRGGRDRGGRGRCEGGMMWGERRRGR